VCVYECVLVWCVCVRARAREREGEREKEREREYIPGELIKELNGA
jgi:hypothetical protein